MALAISLAVLSVIQNVRGEVGKLEVRYANFVEGPGKFQDLKSKLDGMTKDKEEIEEIVRTHPGVVPEVTSLMFCRRLEMIKQHFEKSKDILGELAEDTFPENDNTKWKWRSKKAKLRRAARADVIVKKMETVSNQIKDAATVLEGLVTGLTTWVKIDGNVNRIDVHDVPSAPMSAPTVSLDFISKDADGAFETPEGMLKNCVLTSDSSTKVTAAAGVVGMAGVGKTIALQGLAHEEDIRTRFPDGVHYMSLGHGATLQDVIRQIGKIVLTRGATIILGKVESSSSLDDAVDHAVMAFGGKTCLFLIDDLWPTEHCKTGYLKNLLQLLRGCPNSRMAITTRNVDIAREAGLKVDFGARHPHGPISLRLFLTYATGSVPHELPSGNMRDSVTKILSCCGGLPIALSVAGCSVQFLFEDLDDFDIACDIYADELDETTASLGDEESSGGTSLNAGIMISLKYLDGEFLKWKSDNGLDMNHTVTELYTGLCVLQNQAWIPLSVLCGLWSVDKRCALHVMKRICALSLATLNYRKQNRGTTPEAGLSLHDLHLEFCQRQAERTKTRCTWHAQLLNGYLSASSHTVGTSASTEGSAVEENEVLEFEPREWWAVPEDGYIHANLSRHFSCAGRELELAALILDARWTELRARIGGILALKTDFELLQSSFVQTRSSRNREAMSNVERSFEQIFEALRLSWGWHLSGWRAFQFQVWGRLAHLKQSDKVVGTYLKSVEANTPKPYLVPVSPLFPDIGGAQMLEIPVESGCFCVACSPCGRYIAAGAGNDILVADSSTGEILKRMRGHTRLVSCVTFLVGSEKIVSGSWDGSVMVWTWDSLDTPTQVFEGQSSSVSGVAVSADGQRIISTSRDRAVRAWDSSEGARTWELVEGSSAVSVAICREDGKIALGLFNGTLKILHGVTKETLFEDTKAHEKRVDCISFCPNGSYLATGSADKTVCLWNAQTWTRKCFEGHDDWVTSVAFNRNGNRIASSSDDGTIRLWDVDSGKCVGVSPKQASQMRSVAFTAGVERIVSGSPDGIVRIWEAHLGNGSKEQRDRHNSRVLGVAISADGLRVASASEDGTVRLWDAVTGDHLGAPLEGHQSSVMCVSFSPDGRRVVSGSFDRTLRLWDTETYTHIGNPIQGHTHRVRGVSFSSDGRRIFSGSDDRSVRIWNVETRKQIGDALQGETGRVDWVSESNDGCHIVARDAWLRNTIVWNRDRRAVIWTSQKAENEISDTEAEEIIRSCGPQTPHLWPDCSRFPEYTAELFCEMECVYSNVLGEKTLIGNIPAQNCWMYDKERKVVVVGLVSGYIATLKLITE